METLSSEFEVGFDDSTLANEPSPNPDGEVTRLPPVYCQGLPPSSSTHSALSGSQPPVHPNTGEVTSHQGFFLFCSIVTDADAPTDGGFFLR